jgi:hypothetical protein
MNEKQEETLEFLDQVAVEFYFGKALSRPDPQTFYTLGRTYNA